jgi:hypothetical protein
MANIQGLATGPYGNPYQIFLFLQQLESITTLSPDISYGYVWRDYCYQTLHRGWTMPQEVSISYQAVKSKVYKLVDAMVEGDKSTVEVQESIRRWWNLIHPSDRAVAQKYLLMVLEKSNSTLGAIILGLPEVREGKGLRELAMERIPARTDRAPISSAI